MPSPQADLFPVASLSDLTAEAGEIIAKAKERFRPVATFALFSGGNDSTSMLHLVRQHVDAAVHIVTGIGLPETTEFVRQTCEAWGLRLIEARTDPSVYQKIVLGPDAEGFPGPGFHGVCYQQLKQHRLRSLQTKKTIGDNLILFVSGVRASESARRKVNTKKQKWTEPNEDMPPAAWANPIIGWSSADLADYRLENGVQQSPVAALIHKSGECCCGAFAREGELPEIEYWFPETGKYIRGLEKLAEQAGKPYCRWGWGHDKLAGVPAPGPLCQGCALFDLAEKAGAAHGPS